MIHRHIYESPPALASLSNLLEMIHYQRRRRRQQRSLALLPTFYPQKPTVVGTREPSQRLNVCKNSIERAYKLKETNKQISTATLVYRLHEWQYQLPTNWAPLQTSFRERWMNGRAVFHTSPLSLSSLFCFRSFCLCTPLISCYDVLQRSGLV